MVSSIPVGAKVIYTDGPKGKSTAVIVDRESKRVTHVAVVEKSILHGEERLVPVEKVIKTTPDEIQLNCSSAEVQNMPAFTRTHYLEIEYGESGYAYSAPYMSMHGSVPLDAQPQYVTVQDQVVPEGEVAVLRGMQVEALDGPIGNVGELLLDESGRVTHFLLMKGHGWGKKEVSIPVSEISHGDLDTIYLKVDKDRIEQLPSLPVKRSWKEVHATDLELMVWTYPEKEQADKALDHIHELSEKYAVELLNATVLEKDDEGKMHVHEQKKVPAKRRVALGVALGGLAGLIIGPVALVAGAVAGAVAGKKSAKRVEVGFSEEKLRRLDECLTPGGSALILVVEHRWFHPLEMEMAESGGTLIHERLSDISYDDLVKELEAEDKNS